MNSPLVRQQAERLTERVRREAGEGPEAIETAYRLALGRPPSPAERDRLQAFRDRHTQLAGGTEAQVSGKALAACCQVLLCLNEFIYID